MPPGTFAGAPILFSHYMVIMREPLSPMKNIPLEQLSFGYCLRCQVGNTFYHIDKVLNVYLLNDLFQLLYRGYNVM